MNQPGREPDLSTSAINLTELAPLVSADLTREESDAIRALPAGSAPVSYTHLTLPTIYSV